MMISIKEATRIAEKHVTDILRGSPYHPHLFEPEYHSGVGWIFCYSTKEAMSGDEDVEMAGNIPFLVTEENGEVLSLGMNEYHKYVAQYKKHGNVKI